MKAKTVVIVLFIIGIIAVIAGYNMWNATAPRAAEEAVDISVSAMALYEAFATDEAAAGLKFNDKVVEVTGTVRAISTDTDGRVTLILASGDEMGGVACAFPAGVRPGVGEGEVAVIKGFCAGYNLDVLLQRCAVTK